MHRVNQLHALGAELDVHVCVIVKELCGGVHQP
jgi:hypothetical protein